jgi:hypothetical protein
VCDEVQYISNLLRPVLCLSFCNCWNNWLYLSSQNCGIKLLICRCLFHVIEQNFFISFIISGVGLSPLGTAATSGQLYKPQMIWGWLWSNWWNEDWQGKPKYSEKTCPSAALFTTNPTWPDSGSKPGLRGGKPATPATNRLSYGAARLNSKHVSLMTSPLQCSWGKLCLSPCLFFYARLCFLAFLSIVLLGSTSLSVTYHVHMMPCCYAITLVLCLLQAIQYVCSPFSTQVYSSNSANYPSYKFAPADSSHGVFFF